LKRSTSRRATALNTLAKILFNVAGTFFLGLGVAGIFLPLLPATPFLLLASACYLRGSKRLHELLMGHRHLGPYIRTFRDGRGMPRRAKIYTLLLLWGSILFSAYSVDRVPLRVLLVFIATSATVFILRMPTLDPRSVPEDAPE
jgi:uncharacterized membrane protein YbaN (DUF454 family)